MTGDTNPPAEPGSGSRRFSVVRLRRQWYVAADARDLGRRPMTVTILGTPLVLFRDARGSPAAFLDRCPHRNAPLSLGRVRGGELECAYHGWRFAPAGNCTHVPGLARGGGEEPKGGAAPGRAATVFPSVEQDGLVWVRPDPIEPTGRVHSTDRLEPPSRIEPPDCVETPDRVEPPSRIERPGRVEPPYRIPGLHDPGYGTGRVSYEIGAPLHAVIENILDVPHTAFLHGGLFRRADRRREIEVIVRRRHDRAEAEYVGETRPSGLAGLLLAPRGGEVRHVDRFFLPSIAQVEYSLGERSRLIATHLLTPIDDFRTRGFLVLTAKLPVPLWLVRGVFRAVALRVLQQDRTILEAQTRNVSRFGGERFASTEADVLGSHIWWILRRAERAEQGLEPEPGELFAGELIRRLRMVI